MNYSTYYLTIEGCPTKVVSFVTVWIKKGATLLYGIIHARTGWVYIPSGGKRTWGLGCDGHRSDDGWQLPEWMKAFQVWINLEVMRARASLTSTGMEQMRRHSFRVIALTGSVERGETRIG